jgi:hypothetical protein
MRKSKRLISWRVLRTELHVALQYLNEANYGIVRDIIKQILERVDEYDISGELKKKANSEKNG